VGAKALDWRGIKSEAEKVAIAQSIDSARNLRPYPALSTALSTVETYWKSISAAQRQL
jgi:hypothetical protein